MLKICGTNIYFTRGDTVPLKLEIENDINGERTPYTVRPDDVIRLTVKKNEYTSDIILQKIITGHDAIHILPVDTKELQYGVYVYDVELTTPEGDVYTIIPPSRFEITKEVTF